MKSIILLLLLLFLSAKGNNIINQRDSSIIEQQMLKVTLDIKQNNVAITNTMKFKSLNGLSQIDFLINKNVQINHIEFLGQKLNFELKNDFNLKKYFKKIDNESRKDFDIMAELIVYLPQLTYTGDINFNYVLSATDSVDKAAFSREYIAYQVKGYIGKEGIFLSPAYYWYPTIPGNLSKFDLAVISPDSVLIITQGKLAEDKINGKQRNTRWIINYPASNVHLVGSKFQVQEDSYKEVSIFTYFFPESQKLAPSYLSACKRYLQMYEEMIGPYPFSKFAVVENFFPTGYGMPSYTLLGSQVIRLPFIIDISLGHEIAHNWWGNSVYVNYEEGNWCEGITTYCADHYYKEIKDVEEAVQYRRDLNRDFTVYVDKEKDFPLTEFTERTESASRAIGYGKSSMIFHQLRKIIGDSLFYKSLKKFYTTNKFKEASWLDIQNAVQETYKQNLDWFFEQWLERPSAPSIKFTKVDYHENILSITLQQEETFKLYVPIKINTDDTTFFFKNVWFNKPEQTFKIPVQRKPIRISIDPHHDLFRKLDRNEIPPTLSEIFAQKQAIIVLPDKCTKNKLEAYKKFGEQMSEGDKNISIEPVNNISQMDLLNESLYILGSPSENSILEKLNLSKQREVIIKDSHVTLKDSIVPGPDDLLVLVFRKMNNLNQNICVIAVGENNKVGRVATLISHYGKYSYLLFQNGKNVSKGVYTIDNNPLVYQFQ